MAIIDHISSLSIHRPRDFSRLDNYAHLKGTDKQGALKRVGVLIQDIIQAENPEQRFNIQKQLCRLCFPYFDHKVDNQCRTGENDVSEEMKQKWDELHAIMAELKENAGYYHVEMTRSAHLMALIVFISAYGNYAFDQQGKIQEDAFKDFCRQCGIPKEVYSAYINSTYFESLDTTIYSDHVQINFKGIAYPLIIKFEGLHPNSTQKEVFGDPYLLGLILRYFSFGEMRPLHLANREMRANLVKADLTHVSIVQEKIAFQTHYVRRILECTTLALWKKYSFFGVSWTVRALQPIPEEGVQALIDLINQPVYQRSLENVVNALRLAGVAIEGALQMDEQKARWLKKDLVIIACAIKLIDVSEFKLIYHENMPIHIIDRLRQALINSVNNRASDEYDHLTPDRSQLRNPILIKKEDLTVAGLLSLLAWSKKSFNITDQALDKFEKWEIRSLAEKWVSALSDQLVYLFSTDFFINVDSENKLLHFSANRLFIKKMFFLFIFCIRTGLTHGKFYNRLHHKSRVIILCHKDFINVKKEFIKVLFNGLTNPLQRWQRELKDLGERQEWEALVKRQGLKYFVEKQELEDLVETFKPEYEALEYVKH